MSESRTDSGLFRTRMTGRHTSTTSEAFQVIRMAPWRIDGVPGLQTDLYGWRMHVSEDPAEGEWEMISLRDDIYVNTSNCHYSRERSEVVRSERFVEFHFLLAGATSVRLSDVSDIRIGPPTLGIVQQPEGAQYTVACGPGPWQSVGLHVARDYFQRFVQASVESDNPVPQVLQQAGADGQIYCHQMPLGAEVLQSVKQLLANPYTGHRRLVYADAKVQEILCASLDLWQAYLTHLDGQDPFSSRDRKLIARARDLLLADPGFVLTIPELAAAVGINTSKLKRGFKQLYGTTVFEMRHRFRMQHALRMLAEERLPVSEVALAVGYGHQTSFAVAFRDFFGLAPKDARRLAATPAAGRQP